MSFPTSSYQDRSFKDDDTSTLCPSIDSSQSTLQPDARQSRSSLRSLFKRNRGPNQSQDAQSPSSPSSANSPFAIIASTLGAFDDTINALGHLAAEEERCEAETLERQTSRQEASNNLAVLSRQRRHAKDVSNAVSKQSSQRLQEGFSQKHVSAATAMAETKKQQADEAFFTAEKDAYKSHGTVMGRASFLTHLSKSEAAWNKSDEKSNYSNNVASEANSYFESPVNEG